MIGALQCEGGSEVKRLLDEWENRTPGRRQVMFRALMNVRPSHLLDPKLFDFAALFPGARGAESDGVPRLRDQGSDAADAGRSGKSA